MNDTVSREQTMTPAIRRGVQAWILGAVGGLVAFGAMLFLAAGRLDWFWAWVYLAITGAGLAAHPLLLVPINPSLLAERSKGIRAKGTKNWDRLLVLAASFLLFGSMLVAGLQVRFGWPLPTPLGLNIAGLGLSLVGWGIFMWAMASNAYFAEGVRIQTERGHTVCTSGPYRIVRHPGYVGSMLIVLGTPALLGSWYGVAMAAVSAALFVVRTALEDRTLIAELPGYPEYAEQTRYRLLPGVW